MAPAKQKPTIALKALGSKANGTIFDMGVSLWGLAQGSRIEMSFVEVNASDQNGKSDRILGIAAGTVVAAACNKVYSYSFIPDEPPPAPGEAKVKISFSFAKPGTAAKDQVSAEAPTYVFALSDDQYDVDEGDAWEIQVRAENLDLASQIIPLARIRRQLENQPHTYDWHGGHDIKLYHDGSQNDHGSKGAFFDLKKAIADAQQLVLIADWSFQPLYRLTRTSGASPGDSIGALLAAKATAQSDLLVAIHTWNHTFHWAADAPNDDAEAGLGSIARSVGLPGRPSNLLWRATSREHTGLSHHQKFVVVDCDAGGRRGLKVFFGGLDLTKGRFDWPAHVVSPHDPSAWPFLQHWNTLDNKVHADDWYNAEFAAEKDIETLPRQPWHDIYMSAEGPCAWDFLREFVGRWTRIPSFGGNTGDTDTKHVEALWNKYRQLRDDRKTFVQPYEGKCKGIWALQVYRSLSSAHWAPPDRKPKDGADKAAFASVTWKQGIPAAENSIQRAYQQAIAQAEKFIYIENQYLIGSGRRWQGAKSTINNDIPGCIVDRILAQAKAGKPFHVYIIKPMFPEGPPVSDPSLEIRKNEWMTAQYMVQAVAKELGDDWASYLSFYFLANWSPKATPVSKGGRKDRVRGNDRYMVYVHSKFMIVDDRYFILGSANLNERSQNGGRDSEIACGIWPSLGHDGPGLEKIRGFRRGIWDEHFGGGVASPDNPESPVCISSVEAIGDQNYAAFRTLAAPPNGHACRWPYAVDGDGLLTVAPKRGYKVFDDTALLPDSPNDNVDWSWSSKGVWYIKEAAE
jgi:phospholipase D1/2